MVDELNRAQLERPLLIQQRKSKALAKTLHNYELALSCRAPLSKEYTYVNIHTHAHTYT